MSMHDGSSDRSFMVDPLNYLFSASLNKTFPSFLFSAQKTWYGGADLNFWNYISAVCYRVPNSCISSIAAIENIKSPAAKVNQP